MAKAKSKIETLEEKLVRLEARCAATTGLESYSSNNQARREVLLEIANTRSLSRWEYICLYDYAAWRAYTDKHGLPENHSHADR